MLNGQDADQYPNRRTLNVIEVVKDVILRDLDDFASHRDSNYVVSRFVVVVLIDRLIVVIAVNFVVTTSFPAQLSGLPIVSLTEGICRVRILNQEELPNENGSMGQVARRTEQPRNLHGVRQGLLLQITV
jgi:hypothetical protein